MKSDGMPAARGHAGVVRTERRGDVHDARTVLGGHVVARDHAERLLRGVVPAAGVVASTGFTHGSSCS